MTDRERALIRAARLLVWALDHDSEDAATALEELSEAVRAYPEEVPA